MRSLILLLASLSFNVLAGDPIPIPTQKMVEELAKQGKVIVHKPAGLKQLKDQKDNKK